MDATMPKYFVSVCGAIPRRSFMFTIACSLAALFFSVAAGAELDALK